MRSKVNLTTHAAFCLYCHSLIVYYVDDVAGVDDQFLCKYKPFAKINQSLSVCVCVCVCVSRILRRRLYCQRGKQLLPWQYLIYLDRSLSVRERVLCKVYCLLNTKR